MDLYNNEILGWSYSKKITKELTISALKKAIKKINVVKNCILHSDLGSQYTNKEYLRT
ncbi:MAG: putative transposase [Fusobacteriaceae bacterium]|jgi:transposase InsO family protein|nr:transposase [Fusobacteriales bacterium]MDN5304888.1 putative transposase [Fusobacteriaceae bacterium]